MAESVTVVGIQFQTGGDAQVAKAFKRLGREAGVLKKNFGSLSDKSLRKVKQQLLGVNKATGNSINSMQAQKTALQGLRNMADVTGNEFKRVLKAINTKYGLLSYLIHFDFRKWFRKGSEKPSTAAIIISTNS